MSDSSKHPNKNLFLRNLLLTEVNRFAATYSNRLHVFFGGNLSYLLIELEHSSLVELLRQTHFINNLHRIMRYFERVTLLVTQNDQSKTRRLVLKEHVSSANPFLIESVSKSDYYLLKSILSEIANNFQHNMITLSKSSISSYHLIKNKLTRKISLPEDLTSAPDQQPHDSLIADNPKPIKRRTIYDTLPVISKIKPKENLDLSDGQFRLAYLEQMNKEFSSYNWLLSFIIEGHLNTDALNKSIRFLIKRHESLRTGIDLENKKQIILDDNEIKWTLTHEQISYLTDIDSYIKFQCENYTKDKFNLYEPPLIRSKVIKLPDNKKKQSLFLCVIHHAVFDAFSQTIFLNELSKCYTHYCSGSHEDPTLPIQNLQFADYNQWCQTNLPPLKAQQIEYWKEQLKDLPLLELPTDHPRTAVKTFLGGRVLFDLPEETFKSLKQLALKYDISVFLLLLASFIGFLYRYTGQEDIATGTMTVNREKGPHFQQIKEIIGFLANSIAIRSKVDADMTLETFITSIKETAEKGIFENSDVSYGEVVNAVKPNFEPGRNPLFDTLFVFQNSTYQNLNLLGCEAKSVESGWGTSRFDLVLELTETSDGLRGFFEYDTQLFSESTVLRMVENYEQLVSAFSIDYAQTPISMLPLLSDDELELINSFNPSPSFNQQSCVHEIFELTANSKPDNIALVFGSQQLTYSDLDQAANKVAHNLLSIVTPKNLVVVCMERSLEAEIAVLGILKAGCAVAFIESAKEEIFAALNKISIIKPSLVITDKYTKKFITEESVANTRLINWQYLDQENLTISPKIQVGPDDLALISFTSGTTGSPKAVMVAHRGWVNWADFFNARGAEYNIDSDSQVFLGAPYIFDASYWERLVAYSLGGTLHVNSSLLYRDAAALTALFKQQQISVATFTPSFLALLDPKQLNFLKCVIVIGEPLSKELILKWKQAIPSIVFVNGYGPTESTAGVTFYNCEENESVSIGKPIQNTTIHILDTKKQPVPIGAYGELYIGGVGIAKGYFNLPEKTEQAFIDDPFSRTNRSKLYRTGDKGRFMPDGTIELKGRMGVSNQVKLHGVRIELEEIESSLCQHPSIQQAFVKMWDNSFLTTYILAKESHEINYEEVKLFLKQKGLSSIKIPSDCIFLEEVPLTKNGKLDRSALPRPSPNEENFHIIEFPKTRTEEKLLNIWKEIFYYKEISTTDNFREIGGMSFWIVLMLNKINTLFFTDRPNRLALSDLPDDFNIKTLASLIDNFKKSKVIQTSNSMNEICEEFYSQFRMTNS